MVMCLSKKGSRHAQIRTGFPANKGKPAIIWQAWWWCDQYSSGSCSLGRCKMLNLQQNHLVGLSQLPKLPVVEHLCLSDNAISSLGGLGALGKASLRSLSLLNNPVSFTPNYRAWWADKINVNGALQNETSVTKMHTELVYHQSAVNPFVCWSATMRMFRTFLPPEGISDLMSLCVKEFRL